MAAGEHMSGDEVFRAPITTPPNALLRSQFLQCCNLTLALRHSCARPALRDGDTGIARGTTPGFRRLLEGKETIVGLSVRLDWASVALQRLSNSATWHDLLVAAGRKIEPANPLIEIWIPPRDVSVSERGE